MFPVGAVVPLLFIAARAANASGSGGRAPPPANRNGGNRTPASDGWVTAMNLLIRPLVVCGSGVALWSDGWERQNLVYWFMIFPMLAAPTRTIEHLLVRRGAPRLAHYATRILAPWWTGWDGGAWSRVQAARAAAFSRRPLSKLQAMYFHPDRMWQPVGNAADLLARALGEAARGHPETTRSMLTASLLLDPGVADRPRALAMATAWLADDATARGDVGAAIEFLRHNPGKAGDLEVLGEVLAAESGRPFDAEKLTTRALLRRPRAWPHWHRVVAARARTPHHHPAPPPIPDALQSALIIHMWLRGLPPDRIPSHAWSLHSARWTAAEIAGKANIGRRIAANGARSTVDDVLTTLREGITADLVGPWRSAQLPAGLSLPDGCPAGRARALVAEERRLNLIAQLDGLRDLELRPGARVRWWAAWGEVLHAWAALRRVASQDELRSAMEHIAPHLCTAAAELYNKRGESMLAHSIFAWITHGCHKHGVLHQRNLYTSNTELTR